MEWMGYISMKFHLSISIVQLKHMLYTISCFIILNTLYMYVCYYYYLQLIAVVSKIVCLILKN